jgi:hypothetical protein
MPDQPPTWVPIGELRRIFNEGQYWQKAILGPLWQTIEEEGHPSPPLADEPFCTYSQIIAYRDENARQIARVHQYKRPDGSIGLSGQPDPQELLHEGVLYIAELPEEEDSDAAG